jgi:ribosomal protein S12 methylthiotransferase accessory factor
VLSFCQQRGLPTDDIRIRERVNFNAETHMADEITLDIELPADFPEKYRNALVKSAQLCAVKRHLENPPSFEIITTKTS